MKKLLYLSLLLTIAFQVKSQAATFPETNPPQQKIVRPTVAMTNDQAKDILNKMRQKNSDAEKITVLKAGVKDNGITVAQLTTLLNQFAEDSSKLECAEFAYPYVTDYRSFLKLIDLFNSESKKDDLDAFVRKYKG